MDSRLSILMAGLKQLNKGKENPWAVPKKGTDERFRLNYLMSKEKQKRELQQYLSKIGHTKELTAAEKLSFAITGSF